jgi:archaemetzincin
MRIILIFLFILGLSCSQQQKIKTVYIQPFSDINSAEVQKVYLAVKKVYPQVYLLESIQLPKQAYYVPRNRYRADSIIYWLRNRVKSNEVVIGLTSKDISTSKGNIYDYGVMGLGFRPGTACVVSSFRLNKANLAEEFYKVSIHELGHTQGLPHCPEKTCFMRDAEGRNPTNEEKNFCTNCKKVLQSRGWKI